MTPPSAEIDKDLLAMLACPETKEPVSLAAEALMARVNAAIERGALRTKDGQEVTRPLDGGLLRKDGKVLYAVRGGIPIMLIDESILLEQLDG